MPKNSKFPKGSFILKPLDNLCPQSNHWIVVREMPIDAVTKSGLSLPSGLTTNSDAGTVMAVADACKCGLAPGDIVYFTQTVGYPFTSESVQYKIITERDILALYDTERVVEKLTKEEEKKRKDATKKL